ncbi:12494_t:CDS:1, partial [Dentiscutata heterogama]
NSIYKLFKEDSKQFYKYAINKFNSRFNEYDEYLLIYFIHPLYK